METARLEDAAEDPRFPPWWRFLGFGTAAAVAILLVHFGYLLFAVFLIGAALGFLITYRQRACYSGEGVRNKLAARAPPPGTIWPPVVSAGLVSTAMTLTSGSWGGAPLWAVIAVAAVAGIVVVPLLRRAELSRIAGLLDLERELVSKKRADETAASSTE